MFKKFLSNNRGGVAVNLSLMMIPLALTAGSAYDYSIVRSMQAKAQASIDSAVLAAASTPDVERSERKQIVEKLFQANAELNGIKNVDDIKPATSVTDDEISSAVNFEVPTAFMSIVGFRNVNVNVEAAAAYSGSEEIVEKPCIYLQSFHNPYGALRIGGECGFHVSSNASDSFVMSGSFANQGTKTTTHGEFIGTAGGNPVKEHHPKQTFSDPLSDKSALVAPQLCQDDTGANRVIVARGHTQTITEGTYCHEWVLNGGTLKLGPGTYYLKKPIEMIDPNRRGGSSSIGRRGSRSRGGSSSRSTGELLSVIEGDEVTIVFMDDAKFDVNGQEYKLGMYITPPESGPFKGISIYQDESAKDNRNTISGALNFSEGFRGIVYLPDMDFKYHGAFAFKTRPNQLGIFVARDFRYDPAPRGGTADFYPDEAYETTESSGGDEDQRVYLIR